MHAFVGIKLIFCRFLLLLRGNLMASMTLARCTIGKSNRFPSRIPDKIEADEWFSLFNNENTRDATECQTSRKRNRGDGSRTMNLPLRRISALEFASIATYFILWSWVTSDPFKLSFAARASLYLYSQLEQKKE